MTQWSEEVDAAGGPLNYIKSAKDKIFHTTSSVGSSVFLNEEDCKKLYGGIYLSPFHQELVMRKDVNSADIARLVREVGIQVHSGYLNSDDRISFALELSGLAIVLALKIG